MAEACLYDILDVPQETLRRALPKTSVRTVARLISSYPRAIGRTLQALMAESMSSATIQFLNDQLASGDPPSWGQVRTAEAEFVKVLHDVNLVSEPRLG